MYKLFKYKSYSEKKGNLIPISFNKILGFQVKRVFLISGNKKLIRGNHAHKKCIQSFIQLIGSSKIEIQNKKQKKIVTLNSKKKTGLTVFVRNWIKINFNSKKNLVLVLCSHDYDKSDYINDFEKL
tara:strand:+ start:113 stop:490 length:378 start_codon:yes stop_codon:yes gene_type:complete